VKHRTVRSNSPLVDRDFLPFPRCSVSFYPV